MSHLITLAWRSALNRRSTLVLVLVAVALSVAMLLGVERLRHEAHRSFNLSVSGTDLVVGAKSSPAQLVLYSVLRIGESTSNIGWESFKAINDNPLIAWSVPISLGDSHRGYPVMGTTSSYFEHYRYGDGLPLQIPAGIAFKNTFDVVLGAEVAKKLAYKVGDSITLSHGHGHSQQDLPEHDDKPFIVTGILAPTGTPVDRTLHIPLEGMTAIHLDWVAGVPMPGYQIPQEHVKKFDLTPKEITAVLIGLKSRAAVFKVQRQINKMTIEPLMAVMPGVALDQLWQMVGMAENALLAVSVMVVIVGLSGLAAVILASLDQRRREMAILRAVGARPRDIMMLMIIESMLITTGGIILGIVLLYGITLTLAPYVQTWLGITLQGTVLLAPELKWIVAVMATGLIAGMIPGYRAYQFSLQDGLMPRI